MFFETVMDFEIEIEWHENCCKTCGWNFLMLSIYRTRTLTADWLWSKCYIDTTVNLVHKKPTALGSYAHLIHSCLLQLFDFMYVWSWL